jgi:hypothetical protein
MEKFAINLENLKNSILFDCILQKSKVACKYKYKDFYTNDQEEPENWYEDFIKDVRAAIKYNYKGEDFYVSHPESDASSNSFNLDVICYIFFRDRVYSLDSYYTDCPIFEAIIKEYN